MRKFLLPALVNVFVLLLFAIHPTPVVAANPPAPTNLKYQCNSDNTQVTVSWDNSTDTNVTHYLLRVDNQSVPGQATTCGSTSAGPGDFCNFNLYPPKSSQVVESTFPVTQNVQYGWVASSLGEPSGPYGTAEGSATGPSFKCNLAAPPAVSTPTLVVDPSVPTIDKPITFKASGCNNGEDVGFVWKLDLAPGNLGSQQIKANGNGEASLQLASGTLLQNKYLANITCHGITSKPVPFIVSESTSVDLKKIAEERPDGVVESGEKVTVQASGCPKDALVEFRWDYSGTFQSPNRSARVTADGKGTATFEGTYLTGTVYLAAHCFVDNQEKGKSGVMQFVVLKATATIAPTQPPPPSPVCANYGSNGTCTQVNTAIGPINTNAGDFVLSVFTVILSLSGGIALLIIMYAGYTYLTSRGNPEKIQHGREILVSALVGFLFIIFSFVLMETITGDILRLPGFAKYVFPCRNPDPSNPC